MSDGFIFTSDKRYCDYTELQIQSVIRAFENLETDEDAYGNEYEVSYTVTCQKTH